MKRLIAGWLGFLSVVFLLAGCIGTKVNKPADGTEEREKLNVVTTLFPYYDFTRQIAGDDIELTMVIPAGMDSHSFEPTPAHMLTIQNADIIICNGGEMEQWLRQVLDAVDTTGITIVTMMDYVNAVEEEHVEGMEHAEEAEEANEADEADEAEHAAHEYDEHIWTSPVNAMKITRVISDVIQKADPAHQAAVQTRTEQYLTKLQALHQSFLNLVKEEKRNMIIVGDKFPFRYLSEEYGFDYRAAFSGCSTDTEPSAKTIAYLIDMVKEQQMPVVYYLELSSHRITEIIGEETGAAPMLLHSCHNVSRAEFDGGITYLDLMNQNVENLRKGLVQ